MFPFANRNLHGITCIWETSSEFGDQELLSPPKVPNSLYLDQDPLFKYLKNLDLRNRNDILQIKSRNTKADKHGGFQVMLVANETLLSLRLYAPHLLLPPSSFGPGNFFPSLFCVLIDFALGNLTICTIIGKWRGRVKCCSGSGPP